MTTSINPINVNKNIWGRRLFLATLIQGILILACGIPGAGSGGVPDVAVTGGIPPNEAVAVARNFVIAYDRDYDQQCKDHEVVYLNLSPQMLQDQRINSADKANGISEKAFLRVERACLSGTTDSYVNNEIDLSLMKKNGNWCVGYLLGLDKKDLFLMAGEVDSDQFRCDRRESQQSSSDNPSESAQEQSTANIGDAWSATDEAGENRTTVFSQDATFNLFIELNNAPENTALKVSWIVTKVEGVDPNVVIHETDYTSGDDVIRFNLMTEDSWLVGSYKVDIYLNGNLDRSLAFTVQ